MEPQPESNNLPKKEVETVRIIVKDGQGNILLLKKSDKSLAKGLYEFPGGKIDEIMGENSTLEEQTQASQKELSEEAGVHDANIKLDRLGDFSYEFSGNAGYNNKRKVHVFTAHLNEVKPELLVGQTKDKEGKPEDFHDGYIWVTKEELNKLKTENKLVGNSTNFADFV